MVDRRLPDLFNVTVTRNHVRVCVCVCVYVYISVLDLMPPQCSQIVTSYEISLGSYDQSLSQ